MMLVAIQLSVLGLYLPPVLKEPLTPLNPPQMIISVPVHTAVCSILASGALVVLVAVQLSVLGSYFPPLSKGQTEPGHQLPPQTIISLSLHTAVCKNRPAGALVMLVGVQLSVLGSYLPPVLKSVPPPSQPP